MNRFIAMLGFAQKAGKLVTGDDTCEIYLKKRRIHLLILAGDSSENTKDRFRFLASKHQVTLLELSTKEELSQAVGKSNRAIIGVTDRKFSETLLKAAQATGQ